ncbi:hypothetical protein PTTG_12202 [Puccinia triticina 1-1 BBBD Race 1]|uniref:RING-type domain-containing protein n=2 Tax=Puccinia triticina TaxID=208348 RepID=A0A180GRK9_PUCT1|nr:uncharacterized protein PtA15_10A84 [Puccinia triticina]OAV95456.1 hypothetical protein PTTG_12202 [Puccinia triticina 1-1 BBBD Race 1]WAQ88665.1 hypothetical protein PtA15_10A84 [Puccinia triticina]WAR58742.1 hypothetical protein PtB15_10B81 [Puccinia triticina]
MHPFQNQTHMCIVTAQHGLSFGVSWRLYKSPSAQALVTILKKMDPNSNPTNSQPTEEQPGQSPGGSRPVEEPVAPPPSHPMAPEASAEQAEEAATPADAPPPHAEHQEGAGWAELPAEFGDHFAALFDLLRDGPMVLDFEDDGVATIQDLEANPALAEEAFDLLRHLEALPAPKHCTLCLDQYVEGDDILVLPCHPSHHFHRACIDDWLQAHIPGPNACPICRALI